MIHPDYSLQLLDILLKTKSDEKYTQGNEVDQQEALKLPIVTKENARTITLTSFSYDATSFVPIDEDVESYLKQETTTIIEETANMNKNNAQLEANRKLKEILASLTTKNIYKKDKFNSTTQSIITTIHAIDADSLKRINKAYAPVGSRMVNTTLDGATPEENEDKPGEYTFSLEWCYLGSKSDMTNFLAGEFSNIKNNFEKAVKGISSYAASTSEPYYTDMADNGQPIEPEKLIINIKSTNIYEKSVTVYLGYDYKDGGSTRTGYVYQTFKYYTLEENEDSVTVNSWLYSQVFGANDNGAFYPKKAFIGLFTKMPDAYGKDFIEPEWKTNDNLHTYQRMSLHEDLLYGDMSLNTVRQIGVDDENYPNDATEHKNYLGYAFVDNKEIVLFPEILDENGWGEIVGFGLFENEEKTDGETPYFWGEITNEKGEVVSVPTEKWKVPLFRKNEFKIYLG